MNKNKEIMNGSKSYDCTLTEIYNIDNINLSNDKIKSINSEITSLDSALLNSYIPSLKDTAKVFIIGYKVIITNIIRKIAIIVSNTISLVLLLRLLISILTISLC